jgi:hypothetical protein
MSKKQIIQLAVLAFCLYLGVFFIMTGERDYYEYYDVFGLITLLFLLGVYVIYSQRDSKFMEYLRIFLYILLGFMIYGFLNQNFGLGWNWGNPITYPVSNMGYKLFKTISYMLLDFYPMYILLICAALSLNKPVKMKTLKIGKLKISL